MASKAETLALIKRRMREYSLTGWHRDDCPHVTEDMDRECSPECLKNRAEIEKVEGPWKHWTQTS